MTASSTYPRFAASYNRISRSRSTRRFVDPFRAKTAGEAYGTVLEIGSGNGMNFFFYQKDKVTRVEATEPDLAMLPYAKKSLAEASVPINIIQAPAEELPFAGETFDSAVATLVFCSVNDPVRSFQEILRVLKPEGTLFLFEHVRSYNTLSSGIQDLVVPLTTRLSGNCHWNRDTPSLLKQSGFQISSEKRSGVPLQPIVLIHARKTHNYYVNK